MIALSSFHGFGPWSASCHSCMWASIYLGADFENGSIHVRRRRNYGYNTEDGPLRLAAQNSALKTLTLVLIGTGSHHDVAVTAHGMAFMWGCQRIGMLQTRISQEAGTTLFDIMGDLIQSLCKHILGLAFEGCTSLLWLGHLRSILENQLLLSWCGLYFRNSTDAWKRIRPNWYQ
jgi:hypothetical protein